MKSINVGAFDSSDLPVVSPPFDARSRRIGYDKRRQWIINVHSAHSTILNKVPQVTFAFGSSKSARPRSVKLAVMRLSGKQRTMILGG